MTQPTSENQRDSDVARIDELIRDLDGDERSPKGLVREHLEAARFYLIGSMPLEYQFNLKLTEELLPQIGDQGLQTRIDRFLRSQKARDCSTQT
jgi:hypothetical protein